MYRVMVIFEGIDEWKKVETGYEASDIDEADRIRNQLLDRNPGMNFVVFGDEKREETYADQLHREYGWPRKIRTGGYDAYLKDAQPLIRTEPPLPIYRFPGGERVVPDWNAPYVEVLKD